MLGAPTLVAVTSVALATAGSLTAGAQRSAAAPLPADGLTSLTAPLRMSIPGSDPAVATATATDRETTGAAGTSRALADALEGRETALSRDSRREARQAADEQDLQDTVESRAKARARTLAELAARAEQRAEAVARRSWQLPVSRGYRLTGRFGQCSSLWSSCHTGLDFAAPTGTELRAVAAGRVTEVGYAGAYGNRTIIKLNDGTELWYCHQSSTSVRAGQSVAAGQPVGRVGSTGNVTGPHLHLEVRPRKDDPIDPQRALRAHGVKP